MKEFLERVKFNIIEEEKLDNGKKYKVVINIPLDGGWIDKVSFVVDKYNETTISYS